MNREIVDKFNQLQIKSKYKSTFDISIYDFFFKKGFFKSSPPSGIPKLLNALSDCSECYYGLQIDSYAEGCFHDCEYCWAKSDLSKSNSWNNPMPLPINISEFWELFYTIFETEDAHPLREVIERKTPLRIGSLSDPFMAMDKKYGITLELIKILNFYKYPTVFLTRSHYVTDDRYMDYLDPDLFSIQMSLPSLNKDFTRVIEPGAPSPKLRLQALKKLSDANIWCTVRLNPLFPIYPDGTLSRDLSTDAKTNFFEFDYIDELALYGCKSLLTGFVHLDEKVVELIHKKTQVDLMGFMSSDMKEMVEGFAYSGDEIRKYYEIIKERCQRNKIEFSTCYLGLGESYFWKDQDLWDNKEDCCNIKNRVPSFINETRMIPVSERLKIDNPDMKYIERVIHRFWQSFKSFFFKKVYEK